MRRKESKSGKIISPSDVISKLVSKPTSPKDGTKEHHFIDPDDLEPEDQEDTINPRITDTISIHAEEVRQYIYCKRIPYWRRIACISGTKTRLMERGEEYHQQRSEYNYLQVGDIDNIKNRYFYHKKLHFGGKLDLLRLLEDEIIPVEVKRFYHDRSRASFGHIAQSIVGGLAAEYELEQPMNMIEIKYFYGIKSKIVVTDRLRSSILNIVDDIRTMILDSTLPRPTRNRRKCEVCEYWKICRRV